MRFQRYRFRFALPEARASAWPTVRAMVCLAVYLVAVAVVFARTPSFSEPKDAALGPAPPAFQTRPATPQERVREGTRLVDQSGVFEMTGGRVTFFSDGSQQRFVGLENLGLERIARTIGESIERQQWSITGTVTEYRGVNFLMIEKAVLKDRPAVTRKAEPPLCRQAMTPGCRYTRNRTPDPSLPRGVSSQFDPPP